MILEFLLDVRLAENLVVLKTGSGNANSLAVALDSEDWAEVAGTIAGDDTIFIACWDNQRAKAVHDRLMEFVNK